MPTYNPNAMLLATYATPTVRAAGEVIPGVSDTSAVVWGVASTVSMAASAYHGVKRNNSVGYGIWWGLMGAMFPVITPTIAIAQGYAQRA